MEESSGPGAFVGPVGGECLACVLAHFFFAIMLRQRVEADRVNLCARGFCVNVCSERGNAFCAEASDGNS